MIGGIVASDEYAKANGWTELDRRARAAGVRR